MLQIYFHQLLLEFGLKENPDRKMIKTREQIRLLKCKQIFSLKIVHFAKLMGTTTNRTLDDEIFGPSVIGMYILPTCF